jgi:hypothetical protein
MGIAFDSLLLLSRALPSLAERANKQVLTLGLQDCYFNYDQLLSFLAKHEIAHTPLAQDDVRLTAGFKWLSPEEFEAVRTNVHQETLFRVLGFGRGSVRALDGNAYEGADIVHDLNYPIDDGLAGKFDLVFDGGTTEHVFSVKDSLFNAARLCKTGGVVVHINPADLLTHGFVNFTSCLFRDFYLENGFEEISVCYFGVPTDPRRSSRYFLEFAPELEHSLYPSCATFVYAAFRKAENRDLVVPQQGRYRRLWAKTLPTKQGPWGGRLHAFIPGPARSLVKSVAGPAVDSLRRHAANRHARRVYL